MRSGIAQAGSAAGKSVLVHEPSQEPLGRSAGAFAQTLEKAVGRLGRKRRRGVYDCSGQARW
jgi:hypothetical protein